jgi:hypothetical protein
MAQCDEIISRLIFRYAKTMPEIPHEYVVRHKDLSAEDFREIADTIAMLGVTELFAGRSYRY